MRDATDAFAVVLAAAGLATSAVNSRSVVPLRAHPTTVAAPVIVCVPARDEAGVIADLVADLRAQQGIDDLRVMIYDDESTDGTADVVRDAIAGDARFTLVDGTATPKPDGWTGKAWGLHRLTTDAGVSASTAWICLIDADVRVNPDAIAAAVNVFDNLERHGRVDAAPLGLLSVWPAQIVGSAIESAVQPLLFWSWFSMLPQAVTEHHLRESTAVANGQFLVTRLGLYRDVGGHRSVAAEPADDIALARVFRRAGLRTANRSGGRVVRCRMYRSAHDLRAGYRRWTATEFGGRRGSPVVVAAILVGHVLPVARAVTGPRRGPAIATLAMSTAARLIARRAETDGLSVADIVGAAAHPASMAVAATLIADSAHHTRAGTLAWKGRAIG